MRAYCIRFTTDPELRDTRLACGSIATPIMSWSFSGGGNAKKALLLTLSKQAFS
jgi:hypothetical protein